MGGARKTVSVDAIKERTMEEFQEIREAVAKLCAKYPGEYWRELDRERSYPSAFVKELTEGG